MFLPSDGERGGDGGSQSLKSHCWRTLLRWLLLRRSSAWWRSVRLRVFLRRACGAAGPYAFARGHFQLRVRWPWLWRWCWNWLQAQRTAGQTKNRNKKDKEPKTKCHWNHCHLDTLENSLLPLVLRGSASWIAGHNLRVKKTKRPIRKNQLLSR
jgi:hypothetical protein